MNYGGYDNIKKFLTSYDLEVGQLSILRYQNYPSLMHTYTYESSTQIGGDLATITYCLTSYIDFNIHSLITVYVQQSKI